MFLKGDEENQAWNFCENQSFLTVLLVVRCLVSFFSFFFFKSVSNRAMKMMILEQTLQCNNKLMQRMMIIHS